MRNIKRIVSLMLSFCMLLLINTTAYAGTTKVIRNNMEVIASEFINIALESPDDYGLNGFSGSFQLSDAIIPYAYNDNGILKEMNNTKYYFIYSNNKPIATLIANDDMTSVMFETDTAKELKAFDSDSFTVVCDKKGAHINSTDYDINVSNNLSGINLLNSNLISGMVNKQSAMSDSTILSIPASYGIDIPIIQQYSDDACWAACVASAGKYFTGQSKTARQVCDLMGIGYDDGASIYQIASALNVIYKLNGSVAGGFYPYLADIYTLLSSDIVPIAIFYSNVWDNDPDNDLAHSIIIQGYQASTQGAFLRVMDPNYSSYNLIFNGTNPDGQSTWTLSYGKNNFYWSDTVLAY